MADDLSEFTQVHEVCETDWLCDKLVSQSDPAVRYSLAENEDTPTFFLKKLAADDDINVVQMSSNPGAITVALASLPFSFEGESRKRIAEGGLAALRRSVDAAIALPNEWLRRLTTPQITMKEAFDWSNEYIRQMISGLIKLSHQSERL